MKDYNKAIGDQLKIERQNCGLTLREAATKLGVDNSTISKWESGKNKITAVDLIRYLNILKVRLNDFADKL